MATARPAQPEVGSVDVPTRDAPLFTAYGEDSPFAEAYRSLRVCLFNGDASAVRVLGITGAAPRHGSSTTAANFTLIMAETALRVILVDADLHKPSLHRFFDLPNTVGFSSVLTGEARLEDALQPIDPASRLKLLAGGPAVRNPAAVLRSERVRAILDALREEADLVIVDLPSVSAIAYTAQLAPMLDGVLLVLRAGTEPSDAERLVRRRLRGTNFLGIVLNQVPLQGSDVSAYERYGDVK
jgi:capsular exopolysaccharide synthesis family protein